MITPGLWRALLHPPVKHPLYIWVNMPAPKRASLGCFLIHWLVFASLLILLLPAMMFLLVALFVALAGFAPLVLNAVCARWSAQISGQIAQVREQGTYDLLCVTPMGRSGMNWIISTACVHHMRRLKLVNRTVYVLVGGVVVMSIYSITDLQNFISVISLTGLLFADYVQSTVLAVTVGMTAADIVTSRGAAQVVGAAAFLVIQVVLYLIVIVVGFVALPPIFVQIGIEGTTAQVSGWALRFVVLIGLREFFIWRLWHSMGGELPHAEGESTLLARNTSTLHRPTA